jgi:Ca-activated chloride channel homolog
MDLTWTAPHALWLLLALPLVWLAHAVARTNFNARQRWTQAALRSLLLAALALALGRPVFSASSTRQSVVYAVDISHSISSRAIEEAAVKIDELNRALRPAHSRVVAFGAAPAAIESTAALRRLAQVDPARTGDAVDRRGTDLEAALDGARAALAAGHIPRIVLFSDGQATAGDAGAAVARLTSDRIPVSAEPLAQRSLGDTWIEAIDLPAHISAGAAFVATVAIGSQRQGTAMVELRSGGTIVARQEAAVAIGTTRVPLTAAVDAPGAHVLQAALTMAADPLAANNALGRDAWVAPRAKVLYVEGAPASSRYLSGALTASGFDVSVRPPSGLPVSSGDLDPFDVVVLSDVARARVPDASMSALSHWVEAGGGGLLVAGGEAIFGEGGYRETVLERLTPVTFERRDEPEVALVLVLDRSWSMAGISIDLCKAAAQAAVDVMTDEQSLGILTFNDKFDWDVPLTNVGKSRQEIRKKIAAIQPGGHTLIFPAVEQAYLALRNARARAKHVLLLSDGRSYPDDYESLVQKMASARITVSSIAVGPSSDPELLRNIARWGKGRSYTVADAKQLPEIFVKEAKNAVNPSFDEKAITPVVKAPAFLSGTDLTRVPRLKGLTATVIKDTALEVLTTEDDEPLLAFWPIGLGRAAVFTSDVKDRWAADWVTWDGYGPFFTSVVRALERRRPASVALDVTPGPVRGSARALAIAVEARHPDGRYRDLLHPTVEVRSGTGARRRSATLPVRQVAPGRYEASAIVDAAQPVTISLAGPDAGKLEGPTVRDVVPDPAAEYRFRPPDEALLKSIASATGGAWRPDAKALATVAGDSRTERRALWPALVAAALGLWFVDLLLRRVRVFEPRTEEGSSDNSHRSRKPTSRTVWG